MEDNKTGWHYVTISAVDAANGVYLWKNWAGYEWELTKKPGSPDKFLVDPECPYYDGGHKEATLIFEKGKVVAILGNNDERYSKVYKGETLLEVTPKSAVISHI